MKPFIPKSAVCLGLLLMGFAAGNLVLAGVAGAADMSIIEKRRDVMKNVVLKNFAVVKNYVQKGQGSAADVAKAAQALSVVAPKLPALFPKGTGRPDVDAKKTRAMAKIWEDWPASSITGTGDSAAIAALASQSSAAQGCSNSSTPSGASAAAKRRAWSCVKAWLASIRMVARPRMAS